MSRVILPPPGDPKWGPLAYVPTSERQRIMNLPKPYRDAELKALEREIAAAKKKAKNQSY